MTDLSKYMSGDSDDDSADKAATGSGTHDSDRDDAGVDSGPAESVAPDIDEEKMSPVERIKAYQQGKQFPEFANPPAENTESDDEAADDDTDLPEDVTLENAEITAATKSSDPRLKHWKKYAAGAAALIVGGLILNAVAFDREKSDDAQTSNSSRNTTTSASVSPTPIAIDFPIKPADAKAPSCVLGSNEPMTAFNGGRNEAFLCVMDGGAPGTVITATLPSFTKVKDVMITPGFKGKDHDQKDNWLKYRTIKAAAAYFDDGYSKRSEFSDKREYQSMKLDGYHVTKTVKIVILDTADISQNPAPGATSKPGDGPLLGGLSDWGSSLGGDTGAAPQATSTPATPKSTTFALSIQILGHEA